MPSIEIKSEDLKLVVDRAGLFRLLRQKLGWPSVDPEDPFTYEVKLDGRDVRANVSQIVPFGADDPHPVMLVETDCEFKRGQLREILRGVRADMRNRARFQGKSISDIVFIVASDGYRDMRFCRFLEQDGRQPKLQAFGWARGEENATRTLREVNLPALKMPVERAEGGWDWDAKTWQDAWNVEKVQKEFFEGLKAVFEDYLKLIDLVNASGKNQKLIEKGEEVARLMLQTVVNRLLFLAFVQKKGWLKPPLGDGGLDEGRSKEYLFALWDNCTPTNEFEFHERMRQLFFEGLCQPDERIRLNKANLGRIGGVPYLHGSLFEAGKYEQQRGQYADLGWIKLPNGFYEELIGPEGVFRKFNFTIGESTPDDVEVAVDPEMLGLVFEELMTLREAQESSKRRGDDPRHATGSYYTPRNIVQFMCREALKVYLEPFADRVDVGALVDRHALSGTDIPLAELKSAVEKIKVCDPACGSGAYLVGMLHELNEVLKVLDTRIAEGRADAARTDYRRKLLLLQNAIYGVDLQEFAANMARLRFWLSVAVDMVEPDPLPNLEYKIEAGDTLLAPDPSTAGNLFLQAVHDDADRLGKLKSRYANPFDDSDKADLKRQIEVELTALRATAERDAPCPAGAFDWRVEFAEIFVDREGHPGGFDVILANPPYVMQEEIDSLNASFPGGYKAYLLRAFAESMTGKSDLFCAFYHRANQLLRRGGVQVLICSTGWLDSGYGDKLQEYLLRNSSVLLILDSESDREFVSADINTLISVIKNGVTTGQYAEFVRVRGGIDTYRSQGGSRIIRRSHAELWQTGTLGGRTYKGGKWGGRFLRSPDILLEILSVAGKNFRPLGSVAELRRGLTSNANDFFYVTLLSKLGDVAHIRCDDGSTHELEARYLHPAIVRPGSILVPELSVSHSDYHLVILPPSEQLTSLACKYVRWGETQGFHRRPSLRGKACWYGLDLPAPGLLLTPMARKRRALVGWNSSGLYVDHNLFEISAASVEDLEVIGASMFSTLGYLVSDVYGRANLGQGVIKTEGIDIKQFPILDPGQVSGEHRSRLIRAFRAARSRPIRIIYDDVNQLERQALDDAVLAAAGLSAHGIAEIRARLYDATLRTTWQRQAKARGTRESRQSFDDWQATGQSFGNEDED